MTIFSIGVGGYDLDELRAVASDPPCTHVYTLSDFSDVKSIISEIQQRACDGKLTSLANVILICTRIRRIFHGKELSFNSSRNSQP